MVTVAYCRVSTREQAEEGFSIDGQTAKLRSYARLHDLGDVVVIADSTCVRSSTRAGVIICSSGIDSTVCGLMPKCQGASTCVPAWQDTRKYDTLQTSPFSIRSSGSNCQTSCPGHGARRSLSVTVTSRALPDFTYSSIQDMRGL